jgi:hypothetical protein
MKIAQSRFKRAWKSRRQSLLNLFLANANRKVPLQKVMKAGGAQYGARICELRTLGFNIESGEFLPKKDRARRTWFRLRLKPANFADSGGRDGDLAP